VAPGSSSTGRIAEFLQELRGGMAETFCNQDHGPSIQVDLSDRLNSGRIQGDPAQGFHLDRRVG